MKDGKSSASVISRSRLEFLFDGVFAIAMTILVLELRVPDLVDRHSVAELGHALALEAPTFISYLFSFGMLGMFWYRHNHQFEHFRVITRPMLVLHFVQLASAAFFPFCAGLFGRYPFNPLAGLSYVTCVMTYTWASFANWVVAGRSNAMEPGFAPADIQRARGKLFRGCLLISSLFAFYLFETFVR